MRKIITLALVGIMAFSLPALASDDLEARIAALEERVAALEAQIGAAPEGVSAVQEAEPASLEDVETGMVADGCSLSFKRAELAKNYKDEDVVVLYFDFSNESGDTIAPGIAFFVKVFQNGREQDSDVISDNQAVKDAYTEFRSGANNIEVAFVSKIMDTSDIIVNISSMRDWSLEDVEFAVSLE